MIRLLVFVVELFVDLYFVYLFEELSGLWFGIECRGFGGECVWVVGCIVDVDFMLYLSVGFGFFKSIGWYFNLFKQFDCLLCEFEFVVVLFVDVLVFNFLLVCLVCWRGVLVVYYICFQIWVWVFWRCCKVFCYIDLLFLIIFFEKEFYSNDRVFVYYVGYLIVDELFVFVLDFGEEF